MRIQAYLTAAAINLKRLAAALFAPFVRWLARLRPISVCTLAQRLANACN
jgi:hypothetical protein